ncbi:hypothetical protein Nepgr_014646 [Nepenthes gracilis]|uniref:Uncharacterized protein n=1 Tax=Nepenthes gracilis TaxID=150966 RepID=A0AAD3SL83_NEPGR|nr:hypothetical protein Nepgr_014646 [Nepenthes gracilis]
MILDLLGTRVSFVPCSSANFNGCWHSLAPRFVRSGDDWRWMRKWESGWSKEGGNPFQGRMIAVESALGQMMHPHMWSGHEMVSLTLSLLGSSTF